MSDQTFIAALQIHVVLPSSDSLKAKRSELHHVKAALKRLGVATAEVGHKEAWQRSLLAVALCGDSAARCEEQIGVVERTLDGVFPQGYRLEQQIVSWNDLEALL